MNLESATNFRVQLHKEVYSNEYLLGELEECIMNTGMQISDININGQNKRIDLLINNIERDTSNSICEKMNTAVRLFLSKPEIKHIVEKFNYELVNFYYEMIYNKRTDSIYNLTLLSSINPNDTVILIL